MSTAITLITALAFSANPAKSYAGVTNRFQTCFQTIKAALQKAEFPIIRTQVTVAPIPNDWIVRPLTKSELGKISSLIQESNQYLGKIAPVKEVKVSFSDEYAYMPSRSTIYLEDYSLTGGHSLRRTLQNKHAAKVRDIDTAFLIHEYGHAVLTQNLNDRIPGGYVDLEASLKVRLREVETNLQRLAQEKEANTHLPDVNSRQHELEKLKKEIENKLEDEEFVLQQAFAYEELFADLLAAVHAKDPSAMRKALEKGIASQGMERLGYGNPATRTARDFRSSNKLLGWKQTDEHGIMAPTRSFIGKYYLANPAYRGKESLVLENLFEAIVDEITYLRKYLKDADLRPSRINARLIKNLRSRMAYPSNSNL